MGTTLTGTTPQDTYDSLIKVTDNGPLSGTAKYLSDGLGNDSVLALSTSRVTIGGTNPYVGLLTIYASASFSGGFGIRNSAGTAAGFLATYAAGSGGGSTDISIGSAGFLEMNTAGVERLRITSTGNVGIGTSSPVRMLEVASLADDGEMQLRLRGFASTNSYAELGRESLSTGEFRIKLARNGVVITPLVINDQTGVIGISTGIKFPATQVASADANTLDDYEEGTWTMGISFGGASVGVTASVSTGSYTKIGRQVTVNGYLQLTSKGSSTGAARLTGLPFTIANLNENYSVAAIRYTSVTFANQTQSEGAVGTTTIDLTEITEAGANSTLTNADFANNSSIIVSFTYFV